MTVNVPAIVDRAVTTFPNIDELLGIYKGYAGRSLREQRRVHALISARRAGPLLDTHVLFSLPESRDPNTQLPVLALAPMKERMVRFWDSGRRAGFYDENDSWNVDIPPRYNGPSQVLRARAPVPPVPKSVMPKRWVHPKYWVLFDAAWTALPEDPYLLERIGETQFRIVAHWDITDRERELMALMGLDRD